MAKKQEDNRDVFEKALDYAVPVAGAYLGARAGMRFGAGKKSVARAQQEETKALRKADRSHDGDGWDDWAAKDSALRALKARRAAGGTAGAVTGGAVTGGAAAYVANEEYKKRRK